MKSWKLMGPFVVSASKLGAMLPRRNLRTSELSSHAQTTGMRSTYAGGRSESEPILKRFLGLISRIWRGRIKVDGIFEDAQKEEASCLLQHGGHLQGSDGGHRNIPSFLLSAPYGVQTSSTQFLGLLTQLTCQ